MQNVTIKKTGIFFSFWDEESTSWVEKNIDEVDLPISWYLPYFIDIEAGVTVRTLVLALSKFEKDVDLIFANSLAGIEFKEILQEITSRVKIGTSPISETCLIKMAEISKDEDDDDSPPYVTMFPTMIGLSSSSENTPADDEVHPLSSHSPINWCDLNLLVDTYVEFINIADGSMEYNGFFDWKLYEIIATVLSQISISLQVTKTMQEKAESVSTEGPMTIDELFVWLEELDKILLYKSN